MNAVNTLDDLQHDEHLEAVGFWSEMDHPTEGKLRMPGFPVNFSATPASIRRHPPNLGEHSVEVLSEAGYSSEQIQGDACQRRYALPQIKRPATQARSGS